MIAKIPTESLSFDRQILHQSTAGVDPNKQVEEDGCLEVNVSKKAELCLFL